MLCFQRMKNVFENYRNQWVAILGIFVFGGSFWMIDCALHSDQFLIRKLEIATTNAKVIGKKSIETLAAIPLNKARLMEVDLEQVEKNIYRHPWIESVLLQKIFPDTLKISVKIKQPIAVMQKSDQTLQYVNEKGERFGELSFDRPNDLPVLLGEAWREENRIEQAIEFIKNWNSEQLDDFVELSALEYDAARGIRGLTLYQIPRLNEPVRTLLEFGQTVGTSAFNRFQSLRQVYQYLIEHSKIATKVSIFKNKKIVVKTDRRS